MVVCLVFDIDDTIYVHKTTLLDYKNIRPDYQLKSQLQRIQYPKFVLTNATYGHANMILNKLNIDDEFEKVYSRDNIPYMKPSPYCYDAVENDIGQTLLGESISIIFFDDLLQNLESAKNNGWSTIWISPNYNEGKDYDYVDRSFPTLKEALEKLNF